MNGVSAADRALSFSYTSTVSTWCPPAAHSAIALSAIDLRPIALVARMTPLQVRTTRDLASLMRSCEKRWVGSGGVLRVKGKRRYCKTNKISTAASGQINVHVSSEPPHDNRHPVKLLTGLYYSNASE